ncbi:hypothetical protein ABB37_03361 [Leptomonas pyrrhocoris]|uniref:Uncharacterized protein n=1 Tax=Leptomonas pyrrhocoris TaxID=157538 RepID=A0A0M9G503_LEPPY|nr:hypothetical protein ABB37_03361 [Leptomonas pyrrhocoris]KPA82249.1 hypothetical protein ABB37_03361 [Leptomonas pyrrhocoris]|eukprot:XP_015660688.1 hypothetical protein ABB37_03361 [Leptomonas pyrrhocoris]
MYTNDPHQKKRWFKNSSGADAAASSGYLTPLHKSTRTAAAANTSPARLTASTARSPLPPMWSPMRNSEFVEDRGLKDRPTTVMDPLAALRQCLQYVCSHPEIYGDDVRGLLDREVMHVVRLKASEVALIRGQRPLLVDPLDSTSILQSPRSFASPKALPSISTTSNPAAASFPPTSSLSSPAAAAVGACNGCVPAGDLFGYGSVSFLPPSSAGFSALLRDTRAHATSGRMKMVSAKDESNSPVHLPLLTGTLPLDEPIQWNGTLPPSSSARPATAEANAADAETTIDDGPAPTAAGQTLTDDTDEVVLHETNRALTNMVPSSRDFSLEYPYTDMQHPDDARLFRQVDEPSHNVTLPPSRRDMLWAADGSAVVLDQHGYEVTYLRTQLQQLEAAFNAKCVRLHELESENKLFAEQMKTSEEAAARWSAEHHAMEGKVESLRRELDGWKDRATDALSAATQQSKQRTQHAKQLASNQINDAKQEAARLSQLWRETERALQESRRAFENTEKEANAAHNHLADAFHYLERLERRVARRDAYVQLCERRHRSLEEKYEKLMWGYEELSAVEGRYSYVDYLLTTRPLWSVYQFLCLVEHRGDYMMTEDQGEWKRSMAIMAAPLSEINEASGKRGSAVAEAADQQSWLLFARTPHGGCYPGAYFDPTLVLRLIVSEVTAEATRRGRAKQLRTNLHGSVACRVLRWGERFAIDYLGGQDSFPDSGELNRKFVPVLTLASVLLPLRNQLGALIESERKISTAAAAPTANSSEPPPKETAASAATANATIPNVHRYDEATVRFVLRCFWKERLNAFARQMRTRLRAIQERRQRLAQRNTRRHRNPNFSTSGNSAGGDAPFTRRKADEVRRGGKGDGRGGTAAVPEDDDDDDDDEFTEAAPEISTFLTALVDFSTRFTKLSAAAGGVPGGIPPGVVDEEATAAASSESSPVPNKSTLLRVRGVLARGGSAWVGSTASKIAGGAASASFPSSSSDTAPWDCGRVFFATVLLHNPASDENAAAPAANTIVTGTADTPKLNPVEDGCDTEVAALAEDVRELLAALYYYTMEYKSQDPDFRLFYLVSHQLIPEMVAVNFFASLEAFQADCVALLEKRIQYLVGETENPTKTVFDSEATETSYLVDDPLTSLSRVVQLIDDAPLDGQDEEIEPDSDGEGYGSILPYRPKAHVHSMSNTAQAGMLSAPVSLTADDDRSDAGRRDSDSSSRTTQRRSRELQLLHNIRAYLKERRPSMQQDGDNADDINKTAVFEGEGPLGVSLELDRGDLARSGGGVAPTTDNLSAFAFGDAPPEWMTLEDAVMRTLAPHTALLDAYRDRVGAKTTDAAAIASCTSMASRGSATSAVPTSGREERSYLRRKRNDRKTRHEVAKCLSATRGLLTLNDILALLQGHCFSTYALSCCGTPRFSLTDALMKGNPMGSGRFGGSATGETATATTLLQPLSVVGYMPPTGLHLQRLRFALSLDQPSHVVNAATLFTVDPVTKANTHLYNTYLTLTLDLFQQQQSFLMQCVLSSCAERHERYAAEGAEDCDGQIPIAFLRKGVTKAMAAVQGSTQHAAALVNHFVEYDELLRLEDEVKLEQFADAPLLLNVPAEPTGVLSMSGATSFYRHDTNANRNRSSCHSDDAVPPTGPRRGSVVEEIEFAEFNLREEAESCSLLHIAFAVRMTYIVWGRMCADTAAAMVQRVVQRAVPTSRSQVDPTQASSTALSVVELPEWDIFERQVHQRYRRTLARLRDGHNGDDNPLRRTLRGEYMQALGITSMLPSGGGGGDTAGKVSRGAAGAAGASVAGGDGTTTDKAQSLYPDMARAFNSAEATLPSASRVEGERGTAATNSERSKRKDGARASISHTSPTLSKHSSSISALSEERGKSVLLPPDFGLLSLTRALGFASPVAVPTAGPAGSHTGGTAASSKKAAAKKAAKKSAGKKVVGVESGRLSTEVQEEYTRALSTQLQTFAMRIARLIKLNPQEVHGIAAQGEALHETPSQTQTREEGGTTTVELLRTSALPSVDPEGSLGPLVTTPVRTRMRSVAFVKDAYGSQGLDDDRRSMASNGRDGPARRGSQGAYALMWRPVFAEETRESEATAAHTGSASAVLDVSKLYAACAALSIV